MPVTKIGPKESALQALKARRAAGLSNDLPRPLNGEAQVAAVVDGEEVDPDEIARALTAYRKHRKRSKTVSKAYRNRRRLKAEKDRKDGLAADPTEKMK